MLLAVDFFTFGWYNIQYWAGDCSIYVDLMEVGYAENQMARNN